MLKYVVLEKQIGETPLECAERWRAAAPPAYKHLPLAYAGRLDPMASGKLLVLIGEECKQQTKYHGLDKAYEFEILFGVQSDSGDVLGLTNECDVPLIKKTDLQRVAKRFVGKTSFPYPKFSSKTVAGKPLHTWTLEGRLDEIEIPTYTSRIYQLKLLGTRSLTRSEVWQTATEKIETIPPVTDTRKAIGNDFRRPEVRKTWQQFLENPSGKDKFLIAKFYCVCASGTYMRTLAEEIAKTLNTGGLAFSIHRSEIGKYLPLPLGSGIWLKRF